MAHNGGTKVNYGFYWSAKAWDMAMIPAEAGSCGRVGPPLHAHPDLPVPADGPVMGALYVVFLPFAGFALVAGHALRAAKTWRPTASCTSRWPSAQLGAGRAYLAAASAPRRRRRRPQARHALTARQSGRRWIRPPVSTGAGAGVVDGSRGFRPRRTSGGVRRTDTDGARHPDARTAVFVIDYAAVRRIGFITCVRRPRPAARTGDETASHPELCRAAAQER